MAEYEDKAKKCESLPKAKRAAFLQKSKYLLGLGEQLLADSKDHAKVHRCVCQDTIEATVGSFVSSSSSLLHPSCAEERVFGLIFCKERSDLLQRWVASVGAMSSIAKLLADANLSKAQRADAVHKSKLALATCVRSAARYQRHTIEHLCSRPSTGASEKVDTFPVVQETPSSSYESYIDEQPELDFIHFPGRPRPSLGFVGKEQTGQQLFYAHSAFGVSVHHPSIPPFVFWSCLEMCSRADYRGHSRARETNCDQCVASDGIER